MLSVAFFGYSSVRLDGSEDGVGVLSARLLRWLMWFVREGVVKLYDADTLFLMLAAMLASLAFRRRLLAHPAP